MRGGFWDMWRSPGPDLGKVCSESCQGLQKRQVPEPGLEGQRGLLGATGSSVPEGVGTRERVLIWEPHGCAPMLGQGQIEDGIPTQRLNCLMTVGRHYRA